MNVTMLTATLLASVFKTILLGYLIICLCVCVFSRSPISVAAAAIYMASQASEDKKSQKGTRLDQCVVIG